MRSPRLPGRPGTHVPPVQCHPFLWDFSVSQSLRMRWQMREETVEDLVEGFCGPGLEVITHFHQAPDTTGEERSSSSWALGGKAGTLANSRRLLFSVPAAAAQKT